MLKGPFITGVFFHKESLVMSILKHTVFSLLCLIFSLDNVAASDVFLCKTITFRIIEKHHERVHFKTVKPNSILIFHPLLIYVGKAHSTTLPGHHHNISVMVKIEMAPGSFNAKNIHKLRSVHKGYILFQGLMSTLSTTFIHDTVDITPVACKTVD